jgi:hypothetical protein
MDKAYRADGLPIKQDPEASSASNLPAFIDPPAGAPPYHGFSIWEEVQVEGFTFGVITDFEGTETEWGDAFVIAPDDSRAGLVWSISDTPYFDEVLPADEARWGVWAVGFDGPMKTKEDARRNLARIVPLLRKRWEQWRLLHRR